MDGEAARSVDRVPHGGAEQRDLVDFSANVNPERPDGVGRVYETALAAARSYPHDDYCEYRVTAGEYVGCDPTDVVPTAGGLEAIRLTVGVAVGPGDDVLVPSPSFGEYAREVRLQGGRPAFVPHRELPDRDPAGYALAILCHPNNPTGDAYEADRIRAFADRCRDAGTPLLVDEAFLGFSDRPSLAGRPGVVVARSLTKLYGLPGLRMGFAVAPGDLGEALAAVRRTWTLSTPAAAVGTHCMRQQSFVAETRRRVRTERERMAAELGDRFDVHPSDAPFLLVDLGDCSVPRVLERLREHDIAVRDATTFRGLDSHVRMAVRRPDENDRLLAALADV